MKKFFALLLALTLVLGLAAPAFAAETYTITINMLEPGHTFEAYQIFSGDLSHDEKGREVLSNIEWGTGVAEGKGDDIIADIKEAFKGNANVANVTNAASLATWISNNTTSDSVSIDTVAAIFGKYLSTDYDTSIEGTDVYTISGLAAGYYLVKDEDGSLNGEYDAYTKFILRVVKNQTVTPKADVPEIDKSINDTLDGTYHNYDDFDIADTAYYKWTGTLPSNLAAFDEYYYKFTDTLPVGISVTNVDGYGIEQIYIEDRNGGVVHTFYDRLNNINEVTLEADTDGVTLTLTPGVFVRDNDGKITSVTSYEKIELVFKDLKALYPNLLPSHKIVVKYSALVNRDAVFATPMENNVVLEYSNNPNGEGIGKTTEDEAYAFTFEIKVDKYDADDPAKKLKDAEFKLYYKNIEKVNGVDTEVLYWAQVVTEEMIAAGTEINGKPVVQANLGNIFAWTNDEAEASVLDTDENGYFRVGGLDAGIYYLKETKAPVGYNLMETDVQIDIIPTYNADGSAVDVHYSVDSISQGNSNVVGVRNSAGSTLPVTGGMGTTIFYMVGGLMAAAAVVLLVTKKRMAA